LNDFVVVSRSKFSVTAIRRSGLFEILVLESVVEADRAGVLEAVAEERAIDARPGDGACAAPRSGSATSLTLHLHPCS